MNERCRGTHSSEDRVMYPTLRCASRFLQEYDSFIQIAPTPRPHDLLTSPTVWQVPQVDCLQLDVDASLDEENNCCGVGGSIRNHWGQVVMTFGKNLSC